MLSQELVGYDQDLTRLQPQIDGILSRSRRDQAQFGGRISQATRDNAYKTWCEVKGIETKVWGHLCGVQPVPFGRDPKPDSQEDWALFERAVRAADKLEPNIWMSAVLGLNTRLSRSR